MRPRKRLISLLRCPYPSLRKIPRLRRLPVSAYIAAFFRRDIAVITRPASCRPVCYVCTWEVLLCSGRIDA